jgi:hypothetical protein
MEALKNLLPGRNPDNLVCVAAHRLIAAYRLDAKLLSSAACDPIFAASLIRCKRYGFDQQSFYSANSSKIR